MPQHCVVPRFRVCVKSVGCRVGEWWGCVWVWERYGSFGGSDRARPLHPRAQKAHAVVIAFGPCHPGQPIPWLLWTTCAQVTCRGTPLRSSLAVLVDASSGVSMMLQEFVIAIACTSKDFMLPGMTVT